MAEDKNWWKINIKYLPIKCHYFFLYGGMGATVTFMQVLAKGLGMSATAVGLIYTIVPFCVFLGKPLFGYLTDLLRNLKVILMLIIVLTALAFLAVLLVPPIEENGVKHTLTVLTTCTNKSDIFLLKPSPYLKCMTDMTNRQYKCELTSKCDCLSLIGNLNVTEGSLTNLTFLFTAKADFSSTDTCDCLKSNISNIRCADLDCMPEDGEIISEYKTYHFWVFAALAIIAGTGSVVTFCLSDAVCYEVLGPNSKLYGRQRLWGTLSWGIVTFLAGYMNDYFSRDSYRTNYTPGFLLMLILVIIDLILLLFLEIKKANVSGSIFKDTGEIFKNYYTILFSFGVFVVGALTGLIWNYEFWYLTDLGASQMLLGIDAAVQCLVAEVPFFFFSEWFISTFGHFYCLIGCFAALALRTGLYALLKNPWFVLPVELLHGITFSIFYTDMTLYAAKFAPPGTEATMLGVLGGLYEGLGVATGSLLGGVGFDKLGGQQTFFVASMISITSLITFFIALIILKRNCPDPAARTSECTATNYGSNH